MRYSLKCTSGHQFDSWFRDSKAYDTAKRHGALQCPICGDSHVEKCLMAPSVIGGRSNQQPAEGATRAPPAADAAGETASAPAATPSQGANAEEAGFRELHALRSWMREARSGISAKAQWVGDNFAQEARARHYQRLATTNEQPRGNRDATPARSSQAPDYDGAAAGESKPIWGRATLRETQELLEEGIYVLPLGNDPGDAN